MSEPIAKTYNLLPFQRVFIHELSLVSTSYFKSLAHTTQHHTIQLKIKLSTWSGSDKGKIALHSIDRHLRLAIRNFFIIQETK